MENTIIEKKISALKVSENNIKSINIAIFGVGLVGGTLVDQILENAQKIYQKNKILLNIFAIGNSERLLFCEQSLNTNWKSDLLNKGIKNYTISDVISYSEKQNLENLIAIDNTADSAFIKNYISLVKGYFNLVSSNKIANTVSHSFYKELRLELVKNNKKYLYETNVGAGLPLIDTINLLHQSGENITKIKGVFSGSLSYVFNTFSSENRLFSEILKEALEKGYTEPDPREDLCGNDVARKLLILARELDLENEFEDIEIENLIPENFREVSNDYFLENLFELDAFYQEKKDTQKKGYVLRYVSELSGDLQKTKGILKVKLISVPKSSTLGSLQGSDTLFEIYTDSYEDKPIVIQGAGAGSKVTARGVFGDVLRLAKTINV